MNKLYDAFSQIAKEDTSEPIMKNTETVYAGYTYGKNSLNEAAFDGTQSSRGFLA